MREESGAGSVEQSQASLRDWTTAQSPVVKGSGTLGCAPGTHCGGLRLRGNEKKGSTDLPLISVIIPVLNRVSLLEKALCSVLNQSYPNVEIIVVDGGSTDGTLSILQEYDERVDLWFSDTDAGVYDAMNKGVEHATGDWIMFLGSDDFLVNTLHRVAPYLRERNNIYYGDVYFSHKHRLYGGRFSARRLIRKNLPHQGIFYPKAVFARYRFELRYRVAADYELNLRCFGDKNLQFEYMPLLITIFDDRGGMSSLGNDPDFAQDKGNLVKRYLGTTLHCEFLVRSWLRKLERSIAKGCFKRTGPGRPESK